MKPAPLLTAAQAAEVIKLAEPTLRAQWPGHGAWMSYHAGRKAPWTVGLHRPGKDGRAERYALACGKDPEDAVRRAARERKPRAPRKPKAPREGAPWPIAGDLVDGVQS